MCDPILGSIPRTGGLPLTPEISFSLSFLLPLVFSAFHFFDSAAEIKQNHVHQEKQNKKWLYNCWTGQQTMCVWVKTNWQKVSGSELLYYTFHREASVIWEFLRHKAFLGDTNCDVKKRCNMSMHWVWVYSVLLKGQTMRLYYNTSEHILWLSVCVCFHVYVQTFFCWVCVRAEKARKTVLSRDGVNRRETVGLRFCLKLPILWGVSPPYPVPCDWAGEIQSEPKICTSCGTILFPSHWI